MNQRIKKIDQARRNAVGEVIDGKLYLILHRQTENSKTQTCPFCGGKHTHGGGDGHRAVHCTAPGGCEHVLGASTIFRNVEGQVFDANDGYIIKTLRTPYHSKRKRPRVVKPKLKIVRKG